MSAPRSRGRFAPSPTGDLHLGGAYVAMAARVRATTLVMRMEDLDPPRVVPGAAERIYEDLAWLGIDFDEGPYVQSARSDIYNEAIRRLEARGLVYPCTCTRAEIARIASAPHAGEEGPRYPGTCRDPKNRRSDREPALRLAVPEGTVSFVDERFGTREEDVATVVGDFVLQRADGIFNYQLAVAVDDGTMRVDEVVRGEDLLASTARQVLLMQLLDLKAPSYLHLPMVLGPDGERLAKRHQSRWVGSTIRELRERGVSSSEIASALREAASRVTSWTPPAGWVRARD